MLNLSKEIQLLEKEVTLFHADAVNEEIKTIKCNKNQKRGCNGNSIKCITHDLWDELGEHINLFFENKNLDDVLNVKKKFQRTEN